MKKLSFMIVAAGLLATSALTSCKKEEMKGTTSTSSNKSNASLARNNNYVATGYYYEIGGNGFCLAGSSPCMVVVRPVITQVSSVLSIMTPSPEDNLLQIDKYYSTGMQSAYYSQIEVTTEPNGEKTYHYIP
jgi:hypothetical protein